MGKSFKDYVVNKSKSVIRMQLEWIVPKSTQIKIYGRVSKPPTRRLGDAMVFYVMAELRASDEQRNT